MINNSPEFMYSKLDFKGYPHYKTFFCNKVALDV